MPLNFIDIALVCLLFYGLVRGAFRGFFVEIASLLALVLGVYGALHFSSFTANLLANYLDLEYLPLLAFAITFVGIIIGVSWIGKLLTKLAKVILLGFLNRLLGALFGMCKWLVICGVLIWLLGQINAFFPLLPEELIKESVCFEPLQELGAYLFDKIDNNKNVLDEMPPILQQS